MTTTSQLSANRANAQHSTGPRSEAGKARVRLNPTKHGLAAQILIIDGENSADFDELHLDLLCEHEPASTTEEILVYQMAEQFWFEKRASRLLAEALNKNFTEDNSRQVSLMLRYQTSASRAFHKALTELRKMQKQRSLEEIGFVSQNAEAPAADPAPVPQDAAPELSPQPSAEPAPQPKPEPQPEEPEEMPTYCDLATLNRWDREWELMLRRREEDRKKQNQPNRAA